MRRRMWRLLVALGLTFSMTAALTACGDDDDEDATGTTAEEDTETTEAEDDGSTTTEAEPAAVQQVTVEASSSTEGDAKTYAFSAPEGLTAGAAQFNIVNNGEEPHHAQLIRVNDDATLEDVQAALQSENPIPGLLQVATFVGGTGVTDPMGGESSADAVVELTEGTYVLVCFIENAQGVPHVAAGMFQPFEVGPAENGEPEAPDADASVAGVDFAFEVDSLPADGTVEFTNESDSQLHEMNVMRLNDGATQEDVVAFFDGEAPPGPPPFSSQGGVQAILPGDSQKADLDLGPGEYVLFCALPDPADGVPHYKKGMVSTVTVG